MRRFLILVVSVATLIGLVACGSSGGGGSSVTLASIELTGTTLWTGGGTTQFKASGTYTNNTTQDLTNSVIWNSSNTGVATISNTGLAIPVSAGTTTITATLGSISGSTTWTIPPVISPSNSLVGNWGGTWVTAGLVTIYTGDLSISIASNGAINGTLSVNQKSTWADSTQIPTAVINATVQGSVCFSSGCPSMGTTLQGVPLYATTLNYTFSSALPSDFAPPITSGVMTEPQTGCIEGSQVNCIYGWASSIPNQTNFTLEQQ